MVRPHLRLPV